MAYKVDRTLLVNKGINLQEKINCYSQNVQLVQTELELQEEIIILENAKKMMKAKDEMAAFVSLLEEIKSAFQFIVDHRIDLRKRLMSPIVPNAMPVKYTQQQAFVACCQELPAVIDFLGSAQKKAHVYHCLSNQQITAHMEKELKFVKEYCNQIKYFLSSSEQFLKNINAAGTLLRNNT